jgi:hypothetical protein
MLFLVRVTSTEYNWVSLAEGRHPESPSSHLHEQLRDPARPNCTYCHFMFPFRTYCHLMLQARRTAGAKVTEVKGLTSTELPLYTSTHCHFTLQVTLLLLLLPVLAAAAAAARLSAE